MDSKKVMKINSFSVEFTLIIDSLLYVFRSAIIHFSVFSTIQFIHIIHRTAGRLRFIDMPHFNSEHQIYFEFLGFLRMGEVIEDVKIIYCEEI